MGKYHITTELFQLPGDKERAILYAPLTGFACYANAELCNLLTDLDNRDGRPFSESEKGTLDFLTAKGIINGEPSPLLQEEQLKHFLPGSLTLFLTNRCNLRCIYCYAGAGKENAMNMSWLVAKSAIDFFIRSLHSTGKAIFPLEFHGGGEPFSAFSLMQKAVAYTQQQCRSCGIEPHITAGTNGMLDRRKLDYAVQNFSAMVISFEGLPFVQNRQRPLASGRDSFSALDRALRFLDANKFPYVIRTTVTALNQDRLIETLEFIAGRYACRTWIVEPMQACGSGTPKKVDALTPDLLKFAEKFCHLSELARSYGLLLEYSGAQFDRRSTTFCHVGRNEVAVTPDGCLTNCWEVSSAAHPRAGQFIFGKILPDGKVWVDEIKWQSLRSCRVQNLPLCRDCFAKYHCAGGCPLRMGHLEGRPAADSSFCRSTREIMLQKVRKLLDRAHIDRGYRENWKSFMAKFQEAK